MKNFYIFFFIILLISCGKKKDITFDKEAFLKQGTRIDILASDNKKNKEISNISKLPFNNYKNINFQKYIRKKSFKILDLIIVDNNIVFIDKNSVVFLLDQNLKILKKIKLYKRKEIKDYDFIAFLSISKSKKNLLITDSLGGITAIDIKNLNLKWQKKLLVPFVTKAENYGQDVYCLNINSKIFSLDVNSGNVNWSFETASKISKSINSYKILINNNKLIFSNDYGELYAFDLLKKNLIWSKSLDNKKINLKNINFEMGKILYFQDNIFINSNYGNALSININSGYINWSKEILSKYNSFIYKNYIMYLDEDDYFYIAKINDGKTQYKINLKKYIKTKDIKDEFENAIFFLDNKFINIFIKNNLFKINLNNLKKIDVSKNSLKIKKYFYFKKNFLIFHDDGLILY